MNFEVIKSKYTEKEVRKLLAFIRFFEMSPMMSLCLGFALGALFDIAVILFYLWYQFYINLQSGYGDNTMWFLIVANILYLCAIIWLRKVLYKSVFGETKEKILHYYREADRLCKDLLMDPKKPGLFFVDICIIDTQSNELVVFVNGSNIKRVYYFSRYLKQIIDEGKKVIDLSKLDQIFGLENV